MHFSLSSAAALLGLAGTSVAQGIRSSAYTDPKTGIDFQRYWTKGYSLGIAVPETLGSDVIAQMVFPLEEKKGWAGISFGGGMINSLLFVAWPNGDDIVTSFRLAGSYANPDVYKDTPVKATPIPDGVFMNETHATYTFLCEGCVDKTVTSLTNENPIVGYAWSSIAIDSPADPEAALNYHGAGFGQFGLNIKDAASAKFADWADLAVETAPTPAPAPGTGGNSTVPIPGNSTITPPTTSNVTYDVIVVGGGPAGIIAAERLAETGVSVLLIERGPANTVALGNTAQGLPWNNTLTPYDIPAMGSSLGAMPSTKICSDTASMAGCLLGGSSSINGLNFIHPPERDFSRWPKGWGWSDVSKAADRLYERNPGSTLPSEDGKYYNDHTFKVLSGYLSAKGWKEVDSIEEPNEKHLVYSRPAWSIKNHLRAGPARTYMPFAQDLPNFTLKLETKVIQPIRSGSKITGVLTQAADGSKQIIKVKAGGKVVLAAGAMSTPRLLWHAGIGKADALAIVKENGAKTGVTLPPSTDFIDLPVGHHLQDHAQVMLQFKDSSNFTAYKFSNIATEPVASDLDLYYQGSGPITQAAQRMHLWTSAKGADGRVRYLQGTASAMADGVITVRAFLTHGTTTVGELGIAAGGNTILKTKPWLIDQEDRKAMGDFIQYWLDLTSGSNSTLSYIKPGSTVEDIITTNMISGDHWMGSAKMGVDDGRKSNGSSVVDLDTKVYGTDNLFVVDASIHPDLPTGNTQAIIMIAAEHAAEKIAAIKVDGASSTVPTVPEPISTPTPIAIPSTGSKCKRSLRRRARVPRDFRRRSLY
ncbi:cellobiose dehydrogenase [Fusarium heterosporum]|uniref:Cellobiose dehydrogenase n=1 Tax=Fusarium heterosporum TaxID=42747 RepID=A0A8H5THW0_FUSHE|nr:cellobiose dehydrogenase [Fusarium heterosporum]